MEIKSRVTRFAGLLCIAGALQGFPVIYSANPGGIISVARQGTYHLTGTIVDGYGEPVIGANVVEKGTTNGAITDLDGNFSLNVQQNAILVFSYVVLLYSSQRLLYMVSRSRYYWYHWRHSQSEWYLHLPDYKCISEYHLLSGMHFPKRIHLQFALQ